MAVSPTGEVDWFWYMVALGITTLFFAGISFYLLDKQKKQKKYAWLVDVMAECKDGSMGIMVDKGSKMVPFAIEHDPKNIGLIKHKRYTLLHPDLSKPNTKHRFKNGPEASFFPLPGYFPFSIQSSAALCQLAEDLSEDTRFSWITDQLGLIALMFNATESFPRDAKQLVHDSVSFGDEIPDGYLDDEDDFSEGEFQEECDSEDDFQEEEEEPLDGEEK